MPPAYDRKLMIAYQPKAFEVKKATIEAPLKKLCLFFGELCWPVLPPMLLRLLFLQLQWPFKKSWCPECGAHLSIWSNLGPMCMRALKEKICLGMHCFSFVDGTGFFHFSSRTNCSIYNTTGNRETGAYEQHRCLRKF